MKQYDKLPVTVLWDGEPPQVIREALQEQGPLVAEVWEVSHALVLLYVPFDIPPLWWGKVTSVTDDGEEGASLGLTLQNQTGCVYVDLRLPALRDYTIASVWYDKRGITFTAWRLSASLAFHDNHPHLPRNQADADSE